MAVISDTPSRGRGLLAATASALVPGAGQFAVGRRRWGLALLGATLVLVAAGIWLVTRPTSTLLGLAVLPGALGAMFVANAAVLALRLAATVDAYRAGAHPSVGPEPRPTPSRWRATAVGAGLTVLVVVVSAPHVLAGYYLARSQAVLAAVFVEDPAPSGAIGVAVYSAVPKPSDDPEPDTLAAGETGGAEQPLGPLPRLVDIDTTSGNPWIEQGRLTVAVLGTDAGPNRFAARSDVMMVVTVDTRTGDAAILSVDRYMRDFPVPERIADVYDERCDTGGAWSYLNSLYTCALRRAPDQFAELYPDAGDPAAAAVTETLALMLGIPVPHHALVDMAGFVRVVDALGGVEVDVAEPIRIRMSPADEDSAWRVYDFPAGRQHLDGAEALVYARMRDPGDGPRMRRQRCLVASVVEGEDIASLLRRFPTIATAIERHVTTDIPLRSLPDLVQVLTRVDHDRIVGVGFGPPIYRGQGHVPQLDLIHERVRQVLDDPAAAVESGRTTERAEQLCG